MIECPNILAPVTARPLVPHGCFAWRAVRVTALNLLWECDWFNLITQSLLCSPLRCCLSPSKC